MKARLSHLVENGLPMLLDFVDACGGENWDCDFSKYGAMSLGALAGLCDQAATQPLAEEQHHNTLARKEVACRESTSFG